MPALNAHSLELETLAELGLLGLAALLMLVGGVWASGHARRITNPGFLAGASSALALFAAHSAIDWDWQVPGLMYVVGVLAAGICFAGPHGNRHSEPTWLKATGATMALVAITWSAHIWEANTLLTSATRVVDTAQVLGWTPERERTALAEFEESAWLNPSPLPKTGRALALFDMDRTEEAASEVLAIARANPDWWFGWALVWRMSQRTNPVLASKAKERGLYLRGLGPLADPRVP
jgi:hypothetical protein